MAASSVAGMALGLDAISSITNSEGSRFGALVNVVGGAMGTVFGSVAFRNALALIAANGAIKARLKRTMLLIGLIIYDMLCLSYLASMDLDS